MTVRTIQTTFYRFRRPVQVNRSMHLDSAAKHCFDYMQRNQYAATSAEVHDTESGTLYLSVYLTADGNLHTFYGPGAKARLRQHDKVMRAAEREADED